MSQLAIEVAALRKEFDEIQRQFLLLKEAAELRKDLSGISDELDSLLVAEKSKSVPAAAPTSTTTKVPQPTPSSTITPTKPAPSAAAKPAPSATPAKPSPAPTSSVTPSKPAATPAKPAPATVSTTKPATSSPAKPSPSSPSSAPKSAPSASKPAPAGAAKFGGGGEKCAGCGKSVYPSERFSAMNQAWHNRCFRCTTCQSVLNNNTAFPHQDKPYCKAHYALQTGGRI